MKILDARESRIENRESKPMLLNLDSPILRFCEKDIYFARNTIILEKCV
jgi:hypothetical protein